MYMPPKYPKSKRNAVAQLVESQGRVAQSITCLATCRSRGRKFDPEPVPYFHGDWLWIHSHFISTAHTSLGCRHDRSAGFTFASQTNCCHGTYIGSVLPAHVILKVCEEDDVNDVLFAPLSNNREEASKLTGISNKTTSRIKADSESAVLAPRKPWRDRMEISDFDVCKICINCKIIHNRLDWQPLSLHYYSKRYTQTKKKRPIFIVLYLSIQLRCRSKK